MQNIIQSDISKEMKWRYLYYAMDVIEDRALPDVRDGCKPIHRRILYATYDLGMTHDKPYKKCARIVGEVLGKYHPHGDASAYGALVRMAQDFSMRYPLIDGHGNYGSIDGDSAAAMRYTEGRLQEISSELFKDINKDTVDFVPNFDGEESEPSVLPSRFPNLLVNGSSGIAVGMATNIPPHNLGEVIDATTHFIDNPNCELEDLIKHLPSPDFPTGGEIIKTNELFDLYSTGEGGFILRGKYHIEKEGKAKNIVFTEIPYKVNKQKLCSKIADLVVKSKSNENKDKILQGISDVRDESDREGMRIVIEIKNKEDEYKILARLFQKTDLQIKYSATFRAIANNRPEVLSLKNILYHYIGHQKKVITRRTEFELKKAEERLHILEGLKVALEKIDKVIELIKTSKTNNIAKEKLKDFLNIDDTQAAYILELKLKRLTSLEMDTLDKEYEDLKNTVKSLKNILQNELELLKVLKLELSEIKTKYNDKRRTKLITEDNIQDVSKEDLVEDNTVTICLTDNNYLKKNLKYSENQKVKDDDKIIQLFQTTNKSDLLLFTDKSKLFIRKAYEIDDCEPSKLGEYIPNILDLTQDEKVIYIASTKDWNIDLICVFENGNISRLNLSRIKPQQNRKVSIDKIYNTDSRLLSITSIEKDTDINFMMVSTEGKSILINTKYFKAKDSKNTKGNKAMELGKSFKDNKIIFVKEEPSDDFEFLLTTKKGKFKEFTLKDIVSTDKSNKTRTLKDYIIGKSGNQGNFIMNTRTNNDEVIKVEAKEDEIQYK